MNKLKTTILSLSLITVMAGAAVSPTLGAIGAYFTEADPFLVKQIITLPSLAIMMAFLLYGVFSVRFSSRIIAVTGLLLYIAGGACAGLAQNIYELLLFRFILGLGTGLLMPLCTSLISYSFDKSEQVTLMGYSSSMNNLGAVLAMIFSSVLVVINWRCSFLVYLIGLPVFLMVLIFLPNVKIENAKENKLKGNDVKTLWPLYGAMFITQVVFYALTSNFSLVCAQENLLPTSMIGSIMAFQAAAVVFLPEWFW